MLVASGLERSHFVIYVLLGLLRLKNVLGIDRQGYEKGENGKSRNPTGKSTVLNRAIQLDMIVYMSTDGPVFLYIRKVGVAS